MIGPRRRRRGRRVPDESTTQNEIDKHKRARLAQTLEDVGHAEPGNQDGPNKRWANFKMQPIDVHEPVVPFVGGRHTLRVL